MANLKIPEATPDGPRAKALLVGVYHGSRHHDECVEHLEELSALAKTLGIDTAAMVPCPLRAPSASTYLGTGKLDELVEQVKALDANVVIFDDEIRPNQQRNLEKIMGLPVIDRAEVILEVFAQHARSRESRLQVELAQVQYQFPRLRRLWTHLSRQRGAGVYIKGAGETQLEIDKRILQKRLHQLQGELEEVRQQRDIRRQARQRGHLPTFAIVGYTNVGKSTLLNALTQAGVLVEDKLFATLDTTTRRLTLPNKEPVLLIDTVGFIRKLPHHLVAAFRSTLEEATSADILLHVIDVSHPNAVEQAETTTQVLEDLGAKNIPTVTVLNKLDQVKDKTILARMRMKYPHTVRISALTQEGIPELLKLMEEQLAASRTEVHLRIPHKDYQLVARIMAWGGVISQEYEPEGVDLHANIPTHLLGAVTPYMQKRDPQQT
jgi:GTPase